MSISLLQFLWVFILQILDTHNKVAEKTEIYAPYNILPLDPDSANQAIMRYPEVGLLRWCLYLQFPVDLLTGYPIFRYKLRWLPFVTLGASLGLRITRKSKMKTYWTGSRQYLVFRFFPLRFFRLFYVAFICWWFMCLILLQTLKYVMWIVNWYAERQRGKSKRTPHFIAC